MAIENDAAFAPETSERTAEMAARLAPVEEQRVAEAFGSRRSKFKVSKVFLDEAGATSKLLRPHPVVLVILGVVLAFITFIAYLISVTPVE